MHSIEDGLSIKGLKPSENLPVRDDNLYCMSHSTFVFFQVESDLFCVPTYRFVDESHSFTKLFELPGPNASYIKGSSRENPILLPGIFQRDFQNFMKALYPLNVSVTLKLSKDEWISVLRLSTLWKFLNYRQLAISIFKDGKELRVDSTEKIGYGKEFKIRGWMEEGYAELVNRDKTIDREDVAAIGFETAFSLFRIREARIRGGLGPNIKTAIQEAFKDELDLVEHSELEYRTVDGFEGPPSVQAKPAWPEPATEEGLEQRPQNSGIRQASPNFGLSSWGQEPY